MASTAYAAGCLDSRHKKKVLGSLMSANDILKELLERSKGPYETFDDKGKLLVQHSHELRQSCIELFEAVADEIIYSIVGLHPKDLGLTVEYDTSETIPRIEIRFWEKSTIDAEEIARQFRNLADIPVEIVVMEKASEFKSS